MIKVSVTYIRCFVRKSGCDENRILDPLKSAVVKAGSFQNKLMAIELNVRQVGENIDNQAI